MLKSHSVSTPDVQIIFQGSLLLVGFVKVTRACDWLHDLANKQMTVQAKSSLDYKYPLLNVDSSKVINSHFYKNILLILKD